MTLLEDIALAIDGLYGQNSLYSYHVLKSGQVVFSTDMSDYTVTAMCIVADPLISLDNIPDRFQLAATYWIMHRYYADVMRACRTTTTNSTRWSGRKSAITA